MTHLGHSLRNNGRVGSRRRDGEGGMVGGGWEALRVRGGSQVWHAGEVGGVVRRVVMRGGLERKGGVRTGVGVGDNVDGSLGNRRVRA